MLRPPDDRPPLDREEVQFIERLAAHYTPPPMSPAKRVTLDAALWTRLQRRSRRPFWVPAGATIAVAAVVAWFAMTGWLSIIPTKGNAPGGGSVVTHRLVPWEYELIFPSEPTGIATLDDSPMLPDDYMAIAQVFLDD